jgi:hypothetical protein
LYTIDYRKNNKFSQNNKGEIMLAGLQERYGLTSFALKMIGIVLMVLDHTYEMFGYVGAPEWLTMVGRVVAPIFLFLAAEGYHYTHSKVAYLRNLLVGFWITSLLEFVLQTVLPNDHISLINSIFGTLFLTVLAMWTFDALKAPRKNPKAFLWGIAGVIFLIGGAVLAIAILGLQTQWGAMLVAYILPNALVVEGGVSFILLGLLFHIFRGNRWLQVLGLVLVALPSLIGLNIQVFMILAAPLILLYNGRQGRKDKWFFYIFYPAHIAVLYIVATVLFK